MQKTSLVLLNAVPVLLMIALVPLVRNDYLLAALDLAIIVISFVLGHEKGDAAVFLFGFCIMILFEYLFVSTGVEIFYRNTLFGVMPLWLPLLWGYGFVAIRRGSEVLGR